MARLLNNLNPKFQPNRLKTKASTLINRLCLFVYICKLACLIAIVTTALIGRVVIVQHIRLGLATADATIMQMS